MPQSLTWSSGLAWNTPGATWNGTVNSNLPNTMPNDNRISVELLAATVNLVKAKIAEATALLPFLINLTKEERITLPKLGPASLAFDEQCASYMASEPNLVPPFVIPAEVAKDRALRVQLEDMFREAKRFCEKLDDTRMLVGSEIWMANLSFYQMVRQGAKRDVPGADTIYDDLKERFPGVAGDLEEEPPVPTPPTP